MQTVRGFLQFQFVPHTQTPCRLRSRVTLERWVDVASPAPSPAVQRCRSCRANNPQANHDLKGGGRVKITRPTARWLWPRIALHESDPRLSASQPTKRNNARISIPPRSTGGYHQHFYTAPASRRLSPVFLYRPGEPAVVTSISIPPRRAGG